MRCPVCGRENNNGNKFCDSCGARLVGGNSPKPSKNRAVLLAIVSVLVIILLGECAYLLVLKLKQKPSSTAAATTAVSAEAAPSASATNKPVTTQEKQDPTLFIFDEPTTGLHFHDISKLLASFNALIERGHSVLIIEHNMDIIKCADWVIDMGPDGGNQGGRLVCEGTPETIVACKQSVTGQYLKEKLG